MEKLPEIVVTANAKKFGGKQYGAAPKSEIKKIPKATSYQTTLPKAPQVKKMSLKPNYHYLLNKSRLITFHLVHFQTLQKLRKFQ